MTEQPSYERKLQKQYWHGCRRQILAYVIGGPIGIFIVGLLLYFAANEAWGMAYAVAFLAPLLMLGGAVVIGFIVARRRNRPLDEAFSSIGLTGKQLFAVARSWRGESRGRAVEAQFFKGPTIILQLACATGTRGMMHREHGRMLRWASALSSKEPLDQLPAGLGETVVLADDPGWMRGLLDEQRVAAAVDALLAPSEETFAALAITPAGLMYRMRFLPVAEVTPALVGDWLAKLEIIAEAIEHLGASEQGTELTDLEKWGQGISRRSWWGIAAGCGCVTVLFIILITTILFVLVR